MAMTNRAPAGGSDPDPVPGLRFTVTFGGQVLGTFQECSGLQVEVETMDYMEGGVNDYVHKLPSRLKTPNVVLKRGITHQKKLLDWFWESREKGVKASVKELQVTLMAPGGGKVRGWSLVDAYPVKWMGPNLNASQSSVAIETLEVVHRGLKEV